MFKTFNCFFTLLLLTSISAFSQQKEPIELTFGLEVSILTPVSFFNSDSVVLSGPDLTYRSVNRYVGGYGFGGTIRIKLTEFWNIETALRFARRRYEVTISDPIVGFSDVAELRTSGYEIPLKGLVYIQMADRVYMNVALGVSADFYASDVEFVTPDYAVNMFKETWIRAAAIGSIGVEYRTEKDGYFYVGGNFHQSFGQTMSTWVSYQRDRIPPNIIQTGQVELSYFSIDFKYFFAPKKDTKPKVKYVKPDWKNM